MEKEIIEHGFNFNRRRFLSTMSLGIGSVALGSLLMPDLLKGGGLEEEGLAPGIPHFAPKAKRVIYLFQNGAPSQQELFDYKPKLREMSGQEIPPSVRGTQRLTGMTANQASFPLVGSFVDFKQYGQSQAWVSNLMPYTSKIVDDLCFIRSMYTEAINHDPALTFLQTGSQQGNRPSMGSWLSYGLGNENKNLPNFTVCFHAASVTGRACIPNCGRTASSTRCIRVCSSARARIRCFTCAIPTEWTGKSAAICSTSFRN
jgi:hypothetical protein